MPSLHSAIGAPATRAPRSCVGCSASSKAAAWMFPAGSVLYAWSGSPRGDAVVTASVLQLAAFVSCAADAALAELARIMGDHRVHRPRLRCLPRGGASCRHRYRCRMRQ